MIKGILNNYWSLAYINHVSSFLGIECAKNVCMCEHIHDKVAKMAKSLLFFFFIEYDTLHR